MVMKFKPSLPREKSKLLSLVLIFLRQEMERLAMNSIKSGRLFWMNLNWSNPIMRRLSMSRSKEVSVIR